MTAPDRRLPIHRGPTANRVGTDAPDAPDALDRWLESAVARSGRRNSALTGQRNSHMNGYARHGGGDDTDHDSDAGPGASQPLRDMSPLVATAREFHAHIGDAERQHGPAVPETEIWDRIMNDRLSLPGTSPALPMPVVPRQVRSAPALPAPYATANSTSRKRSAFMNVLTGTHPAVSLLLAAAVAVAILAVFRSFAETGIAPVGPLVAPPVAPTEAATGGGQSGSGSEIHLPASGSGPAAAFLAAATPASPEAETERWLTDADQAECTPGGVPATPGSQPHVPGRGPLPFSPADPAEQLAAAEVYLQFHACDLLGALPEPSATGANGANGLLTVDASSLESPLLSAEVAFGSGLSVEPIDPQLQRYLSELSAALPNQEWMDYIIEGPQLVAAASPGGFTSKSHRVVLPEDIMRLADGRIGGPMRIYLQTNDPGRAASLFAMRPFVETGFVILTVENGRWVIDELLTICVGDCARYWQSFGTQATPEAAPPIEAPAPANLPATPVTTSEAGTSIAALPIDGTLLIDTGASIISRPLDGSPETRLQSDDQLDPPMYTRTDVPNVAFSTYDKIARNVRTGEVLRTNPYENSIVIGPFWVQYTSQNPAVPVDARIVDLRTIETAGFFDLTGVDPAGLGPQWLIEGTASGTLGVGVVDRATETGPLLAPTMLLIDGDLERTRAVPLWLPGEIDFDGDVLAFSPDGSLVAYLTGTTGNVAIQVETISGELIQRIPWPGEQPIDRLNLTDAGTLVIMAEGRVSTVDVRQGANPLPISAYPDEIWDAVLSPDGSHLLFATFDPLSDPNVTANTAWHMLDIGTGELTPIPQATGGSRIGLGGANEAASVMLSVPIGPLTDGTYRMLFVDVMTGAVTAAQPTGVTSGSDYGEPISGDGIVFAAYGSGSPETAPYRIEGGFSSLTLNGSITVFDAASQSVVTIPMPEIPATEIEPSLIVSPDGRHVVLSVCWTDAEGEHAQSWVTTTDGASGWTAIDGGLVIQWIDD